MKKLFAALTCMALMLSVTACSNNGGAASDAASNSGSASSTPAGELSGKKISVMTPYLSSVTTNQMCGYLEEDLKAKGGRGHRHRHRQRLC